MPTNIKVAIATGDAVLKYVEDDTTVGSNGTADGNIPSTTRIMAIHALASGCDCDSISTVSTETGVGTILILELFLRV